MSKSKGGPVLVFFHPARVALNEEVRKHPALMEQLADLKRETPSAEFPELIGAIAAYCHIGMDGLYSQEDLDLLANALCMKLRAKRSIIIH